MWHIPVTLMIRHSLLNRKLDSVVSKQMKHFDAPHYSCQKMQEFNQTHYGLGQCVSLLLRMVHQIA